jgi:hypothetical protein
MRREAKAFLAMAVSWVLIVTLLLVLLYNAGLKPHEWEFERKLANTGYAAEPRVALSEDAIHIAYFHHPALDESLYAYERANVVYTRSDDRGKSWTKRIICTECNAVRKSLAITSSGDSVYLAWSGATKNTLNEVMVAVSHDQGMTWTGSKRLGTHHRDNIEWLDIQAEDDLVFVSYESRSSDPMWRRAVFIASSENGGIDWSDVRVVPDQARAPYSAQLVDDVLWVSTCLSFGDYNLSYLLSTSDLGATWTSSEIGNPEDSGVCALGMTIIDERINILSHGGYARADVESLNWSRLDSNVTGYRLLQSNGTLLAFSYSRDDGMYVQLGPNNGDEWRNRFRVLAFDENYQRVKDMKPFGSDVVLLWVERLGPVEFRSEEVYLKISHDSGTTWSEPKRATDHYNELAVPLFGTAIGLLLLVTPLTVWSRRELVRARREKPVLLWPTERLAERKSSITDREGD